MKKLISYFVIGSVLTCSIIPFKVFADSSSTKKERKEIIIKYRNNSEADHENTRNSIKKDLNLQKFRKKKSIHTDKYDLELIETGDIDDVGKIVDKLKKQSNVEYAVPNHKINVDKPIHLSIPKDPMFDLQWGLYNKGQDIQGIKGTKNIDINILPAWGITKGSSNIVVGVLDGGIDINHPDLKSSIYINKSEIEGNGKDDDNNGYIDDINGWDFANYDNSVFNNEVSDSHSTHIAGIIAAKDNNDGIVGVAPEVKILPLKFINDTNGGYVSDVIEAIEYSKKMGISIYNCSWSMSDYNQALEDEMKNIDAVFVCAAGNFSSDVSINPVYPACFNIPNIITVASINNAGNLSYFSNVNLR